MPCNNEEASCDEFPIVTRRKAGKTEKVTKKTAEKLAKKMAAHYG